MNGQVIARQDYKEAAYRITLNIATGTGIYGVRVSDAAGWSETKKAADRLTLQSSDGRQYATISIMRFGADASFEDFKRLCQLRLEAEKKDSPDCFIQSEPPFDIKGRFGFFYSGGVKRTGRVFSGHLTLTKRELINS